MIVMKHVRKSVLVLGLLFMETVILLEAAVWKFSTEIFVFCSGAYLMS
jgi:hypothetical protein